MLLDEHVSDVEITVPHSAASATAVEMVPDAVVVPQPAPTAPRPVWKWAAAAGVLVLLVGSAAILRADGDDSAKVTETRTAVSGGDSPSSASAGRVDDNGPVAVALGEVDLLLSANSAKKAKEAETLLSPLREEFPDEVVFVWRQGRALALQPRKIARALEVYGEAVDADPTLLNEGTFYAQLHELLRKPKIRTEAIAFSLKRVGDYCDDFLVETVNDDREPLQYDARHEVLASLRENQETASRVDARLNRALDVMQAAAASAPCKAYAAALDAVMEAPEYYFYNRVEKATVPQAPAEVDPASKDDVELCGRLPERREQVLAALAPLDPDAQETGGDIVILDEGDEVPADAPKSKPKPKPKPKKKRKKSSSSSDCNRFGAAFSKKCRNK